MIPKSLVTEARSPSHFPPQPLQHDPCCGRLGSRDFPQAAIAAAAQDPLYVKLQPLVTVSPAQRLKSNLSNSRKLVLSMFRGVHLVSTVVHVAHR